MPPKEGNPRWKGSGSFEPLAGKGRTVYAGAAFKF
jgi:hypothetical protein